MKNHRQIVLSHPQRGAALIVSLIMLVMVSLLAAGGFLITTSEARAAANWGDRQRALFMAEDALVQAVDVITTLNKTTGARELQAAAATAATGSFYQRDAGTFDATTGWPATITPGEGCTAVSNATTKSTACYVIVFDGLAPQSNMSLASTSSSLPPASARFTFYARAGGQRANTFVVLSTSRAFN